ncbi:MAG: hypothetical protein H5T59_10825 [Anaerolineae bacterium]|nr:hypothetical protein [Anaerolineae bacterium]
MAADASPQAPGMPGRLKSGLLFALVGFVVGLAVGFLANVCMLPLSAALGAAAGYLAARWESAPSLIQARQGGLLAGLLAGVGSGLGTLAGGALAALWAGPSVLEWLGQQAGMPTETSLFWLSALCTVSCIGGLGLAAAAALGALGGATWYGWRGPGSQAAAEAPGQGPLSAPGRSALVWMVGVLALLVCCVAGFLVVSWLALTGMAGVGM